MLNASCAPAQAVTSKNTVVVDARKARLATPRSVPRAIHGRRMPKRDVVRSDSAPKTF